MNRLTPTVYGARHVLHTLGIEESEVFGRVRVIAPDQMSEPRRIAGHHLIADYGVQILLWLHVHAFEVDSHAYTFARYGPGTRPVNEVATEDNDRTLGGF